MLQEWPQKSRSSGPRAHLSCCPTRPTSKDRGGEAGARPEPTWPDLQPARPAQLKGLSATTRGHVTPSGPGCRPLLCMDVKARPEQPLWARRQQARVTQRASEDGAPASRLHSPRGGCARCVSSARWPGPTPAGGDHEAGLPRVERALADLHPESKRSQASSFVWKVYSKQHKLSVNHQTKA